MNAFKSIKHDLGEGSAVNLEDFDSKTIEKDQTEIDSAANIEKAENLDHNSGSSEEDGDDLIMR